MLLMLQLSKMCVTAAEAVDVVSSEALDVADAKVVILTKALI
jgi:hypothetical protein